MKCEEQIHLSQKIDALRHKAENHTLSLGEMVDSIGEKGFGILLFFLSLPSALPIPAAGYSTPFGIVITYLAMQMIIGKQSPWLPNKTRKMKIGPKIGAKMLKTSSWFVKKIEPFICPRLSFICSRGGMVFMGFLVLFMGFLMILPIPLTNTFPAMTIFFIAIGLIEHDGLFCLLAIFLATLASLLYIYVVYLLIVYGTEAVINLKDAIVAQLASWFGVIF